MPSFDDTWEVERVVQYRKYYNGEQLLVKWKGYGETLNNLEALENILSEEARNDALQVKTVTTSA